MCMARSLGSFAAPRGIHETPAWLSLVVSSLDIGLAGGGNGIAGSLPFPPLRSPSRRVVARIVTGPHDAHRQDLHLPMRYATGRRRSVIRLRISHQTEDVRTKKTGESTRQSRRGNKMSQPEPSAVRAQRLVRQCSNRAERMIGRHPLFRRYVAEHVTGLLIVSAHVVAPFRCPGSIVVRRDRSVDPLAPTFSAAC